MDNLFLMEPEKYFAPPSTWDRERARAAIIMRMESGNYLASEKIDGYWSRFVRQGDVCKQQTRVVSKVTGTYGESQDKIPFIFNFLEKVTTGDTVLLGELYTLSRNVSDMKRIMGAKTERALARQVDNIDKVRFYVFDVLYWNGQSFMKTEFSDRAAFLTKVIAPRITQNPYITVAQFTEGEFAMDRLDEVLSTGGEGIVLQRKDGIYEPGKRPAWKSIKMKKELERDVDVFMLGALPPTREYNGIYIDSWPFWEDIRTREKLPVNEIRNNVLRYQAGDPIEPVSKNYYYNWPSAIECGVYDKTGKIWNVCSVSGLSDEIKSNIAENPARYHMRPLTLTGMEFTDDYSIRHPRFLGFRDDIDAKDCTWEKIFDVEF